MHSTPIESLTRSLPSLRYWSLAALGTWIFAEGLMGLLAGRLAVAAPATWLQGATLIGATLGYASVILWVGGVLCTSHSRVLWPLLCAGAGLALWYSWPAQGGLDASLDPISVALFPIGAATGLLALWRRAKPSGERAAWPGAFIWIAVMLTCLELAWLRALEATAILSPLTWDGYAYRLDEIIAPSLISGLARATDAVSSVEGLAAAASMALIPALALMTGLTLRFGRAHQLKVWKLQLACAAAWVAYWIVPVCGPSLFREAGLPAGVSADALLSPVVMPPLPRGAMPSIQFAGAIFVLFIACALRSRWAIACAATVCLATAWAALALGRHYAIDLIVALPFAVALVTAILRHGLYSTPAVAPWLWSCAALTGVWLIAMRVAPVHLIANPWLVWAGMAASMICATKAFTAALGALGRGEVGSGEVAPTTASAAVPAWITGAFFISGVAGLIYEVVFSKALAVTFGGTALANYTVLATYMGGMAIGAWLGGIVVERLKRPLLAYAACEGAIGLYAMLTPALFVAMQSVYVAAAADVDPSSPWLTALRVSLGAVVLGIPTVLMGATLPFMFKHVTGLRVGSADAVARLYGANVLGAALGSTLAGYVFLPAVGRNGATYVAAVVGLMIALYVLERVKRGEGEYRSAGPEPAPAVQPVPSVQPRSLMWLGLAALTVGGAITLGLEVIYMHLLAVVAGNSAYAFALMLSAFLLGLGLGSEVGRRWLRRSNPVLIIALAEFALSASIALTAHGWESIPRYFSSFGLAAISLPFSGREAIRALVCLLVMLPPALCIGIVYPAAMSISAPALGRSRESRGVGAASALNTAGNIAGVLVTGFLLLPQFGSLQVLKAFALAAFALAFAAAALTAQRHAFFGVRRRAAVTATAALGSAWALYAYPGGWNYQDLTMGANLYFQDQGWGRHVEHAESVSGGLTSVAISEDGVHTLLTNGKLQGDDAQGRDRVAQVAIAMPSLLHTAERGSALVIGYGTGMATNVMHAAGFRRIEVVELARDIVSLADKYFESTNGGVLRQPGVALHITDGRNFLLTQNRRFDVVSIQLSGVWFAGAANLYSKEFYDLVQRRLNPDGVLQQWIQLHHIYPIDLVYVIGSVRAKFRYVWLYVVGAQGIIVASNSDRALDPGPALTRILETATMEQYIAMFAGRPEQLARLVQLTPAEVDRIVTRVDPEFKVFASTDTNLFLEYSTPKGNARTEPDVVRTNLRALHQMARGP